MPQKVSADRRLVLALILTEHAADGSIFVNAPNGFAEDIRHSQHH
jgi:hypothetical protein